MRIEIAYTSPRRQRLKSSPAQALVDEYIQRASRYAPVFITSYESEAAFLALLERQAARTPPTLVLLDSRGQNLPSVGIAERLGRWRDGGQQQVVFAVGPPDGWSATAFARAHLRLAFGAVTLPHELALVVLSEQIYRALTILAGHPYHGGHL